VIIRVFAATLLFLASVQACGTAFAQEDGRSLWQPYYISPRAGGQHTSLDGDWELSYRDTPIKSLQELASQPQWISASVPSSVQWALYRAGELPHPYYHLNSKEYTWVPDKVWYYRRQFQVPTSASSQYVFLCFDGLGYYSKVWLNGELLGRHEGMFGGPMVEVSQRLRQKGPNELIVETRAPSYGLPTWNYKSLEDAIVPWGIGGGHPYVTGNSGIGTKEFLPFGIWRDVRLEIVPPTHMERPFLVTQDANSREARLALTAEVMVNTHSLNFQLHPWKDAILGAYRDAWTSKRVATPLDLQIQFFEKGGAQPVLNHTFPLQLYEGRNWIKEEIRFPSPKLWWPNGMGKPNLYTVRLALMSEGRRVDNLEFEFGIRTIRTVPSAGPRTQDRWENWQFVVNGRPLFIKGVNWAWPMDVLLNLPRERYVWQLGAARAAGIQMMRVWGGGNPETEDFFALCDELGIMVWEDFPIANTDTPGWKQDVWEAQAAQIIFRLRNHPSLAVWCGGNEFNAYSFGNAATLGVLERLVTNFDGTRLFTRTTPDPGDVHAYTDMDPTWFGQVYSLVPFVSETGIFDICEPESIREVVNPREFEGRLPGVFSKEFAASHPDFVHHFLQYELVGPQQTLWSRASQVDDISAPTLEGLIDASRVAVGEFFQISSDLLQANYPVTTGLMPWSFTIPWPVVFPAWMDALDQATAVYYFLKRTYEPTHVAIRLPHLVWAKGESVPISVSVILSPEKALADVRVSVEVFNQLFDSVWRVDRPVVMKAGPSVNNLDLGQFTIPASLEDKFFFLVADLNEADGRLISRSVYWPRCLKLMADPEFLKKYRGSPQPSLKFDHGPWLRPQVAATHTTLELAVTSRQDIEQNLGRLQVRVRNAGSTPAFLTQIDIKGTKRAFYGTDNFFWLASGEERSLEFNVLWRDASTRDRAFLTAHAWNAQSNQVAIPAR
jgi:beta-mannosidase